MKLKITSVVLVLLLATVASALPQQALNAINKAKQQGKAFLHNDSLSNLPHIFVVIAERGCEVNTTILKQKYYGNYEFLTVKIYPKQIPIIAKNPCVLFFGDEHSKHGLITAFKSKLVKTRNVEVITPEHKDILEEQYKPLPGQKDVRQSFVTPQNPVILQLAEEYPTPRKAYNYAVMNWVYVSDNVLWGVNEYWMKPEDFITKTPSMPTNPTNEIASDCEEKANTLASILIAQGEEARVCIGEVDSGNGSGGHAWVEIWEDGKWLQLELASSKEYNEETKKIETLYVFPYDMFKEEIYPVIEYWACYNDRYYIDFIEKKSNAPATWETEDSISKQINSMFKQENFLDILVYKFKKIKLQVDQMIPEDINQFGREYWLWLVGGMVFIWVFRKII